MKFATALVAGAAAVSAAAVPRAATSGQWPISSFSFSGVRTSIYEFYRLTVSDDAGHSTTCSTTTSTGPEISSFPYTACADSCWSFGFFYINRTNPEPGYSLQVTHEIYPSNGAAAYNETGCVFIGESYIKTTTDSNPNAVYQYVDWPESFDLSWSTSECIYH